MPHQLSHWQIDYYKSYFALFDGDGDGSINADELSPLMNELGHPKSKEELAEIVRDRDADGSGAIGVNEFVDLMANIMMYIGADREIKKDAFKKYDKDGNGFISAEELRQGLEAAGWKTNDKVADDMLRKVDTDGDGRVNYEEFFKSELSDKDKTATDKTDKSE